MTRLQLSSYQSVPFKNVKIRIRLQLLQTLLISANHLLVIEKYPLIVNPGMGDVVT
jgi:hypothetical protein